MTYLSDQEFAQRKAYADMLKSGICESCTSFDSCVSRLALDPHTLRLSGGVGSSSRRRKRDYRFALALFVGLLVSFLLVSFCFADQEGCEAFWEPQNKGYAVYCHIFVDSQGEGDSPVTIITNFIGGCTNCLQMSPQEMADWKSDSLALTSYIGLEAFNVLSAASNILREVQLLMHAPDGLQYFTGTLQGSAAANVARTNFVHSYIEALPSTNLVRAAWSEALQKPTGNASTQPQSGYQVGAWNGALSYAQYASVQVANFEPIANAIISHAGEIKAGVSDLDSRIRALPETPCGDGSGGDGGGGSGGDGDYYNWCTYEQGRAIIDLLTSLDEYCKKSYGTLDGISNLVWQHENTLRDGLWTSYTGLPKNLYSFSETNKSWKTFYLEAGDKGLEFGYQPTNILQRIELLLYGISGVSEDDKESPFEVKDDNAYSNSINEVGLSFTQISDDSFLDDSKESLDTLSTSLSSFFSSFSGMGNSSISASDSFIASVTVNVGEEQFTMPAFGFGDEQSVGIANGFKETCRIFCTIIYLVGGALLFWRYWVWFASWAIKFSKWATELIGGLFTS